MNESVFDVVVIGAGVVGSAIARDLAGTGNRVGLLDAREDVCEGTSKANTAILHTGYDAKPGTLEARLVARGYHLTWEYCRRTGIACRRTGAVLVAWDADQAESLPGLEERAQQNGYADCRSMSVEEVYEQLPHLGEGVTGGLEVPGESIIDPWSVPLGFASEAVRRGAELLLGRRVTGVTVRADDSVLETDRGPVRTRWVVNSAGLGGDLIDAMFGYDRLAVHPRRGELLVYDKLSSRLAERIVLAAPSRMGKGVLVSPTIFGNIMVGPTAEDMEDRTDTATTLDGLDFLQEKCHRIVPELQREEISATYAGLRAAHNLADYLLEVDESQRYVITAGIRSTGLTSALAVSEYVLGLLDGTSLDVTMRAGLPGPPQVPPLGQAQTRPFEDEGLIESDPEYGTMVCFCERVSRGEIRDAMRSTIPPATTSGLRRRTRAMNGRCQAFFCGAEVQRLFNEFKEI